VVDAIKRALGGEGRRSDLLQMITAARGAINGLMPEVLKDHVREYLLPRDTEARRARVGCRRGANRDYPLLSRLGCARDRVRFARYYPATKMWMLNRSTLKLAFALPLELTTTSLSITRPQGVVSIADRRPTHVFSWRRLRSRSPVCLRSARVAVGTTVAGRPPGHRRRSPAPGSHRT
jgi:Metal-sensitive transcriptional repressor